MNINPKAIRILCFGDSLTWGAPPDDSPRYPVNVRWPGQLQQLLGETFEVIEEGLGGRTTALDDPKEDGRNGKTYLIPCLRSQIPLDLVVLLLGSNDLKERFNLSPEQIAKNIEDLIKTIQTEAPEAKIILFAPPLVNEHIATPMEGMKGAEEKSKQLAKFYSVVAQRQNCAFVDLSQLVQPSQIDGCHLEIDAQEKIAEIIEEKIKAAFI